MSERMKTNWRRELITLYHLLDYLDQISFSDRNKEIVKRYADGHTAASIAREYGISQCRVAQIIDDFIWKCSLLEGME